MRAARIHEYGAPELLKVEDVERPQPGPKDVLVRVLASSVNPVDFKIRGGHQRAVIRLRFPWILGMDLSGVVESVGAKVTQFSPGDEVFSSPSHFRMGCYAEYVAVREDELARKPASLDHLQAASIPLVGLTAYQALMNSAQLRAGERVLIQAGSGGVGTFAIQLAKHVGAHVITTCSERNHELVRALGADEVIDYHKTPFEEAAGKVDVVMDTIGGDHLDRALKILKPGGRLLSITPRMPDFTKKYGPALGLVMLGFRIASLWLRARFSGGKMSVVTRSPSGAELQKIAALIEEGAIKPAIDKVFPLEKIVEAHRYMETGRARGKVVIDLRTDNPA